MPSVLSPELGLRFGLCFRLEQEAIFKAVVRKQANCIFLLSGSKMRRSGRTFAEKGLSCPKAQAKDSCFSNALVDYLAINKSVDINSVGIFR